MSTRNSNDVAFEALLRQAVIDNYLEEITSIPSNEELYKIYSFSPEFELKMDKLFSKDKAKDNFKQILYYTKRVAILIMATSTILFSALLFNSDVRASVVRVGVNIYEQFTSIRFNNATYVNLADFEINIGYLPDGYFEYSREELGDVGIITITNKEKVLYIIYSSNMDNFVDNENRIFEERIINDDIVFVTTATGKDFDNILIGSIGSLTINIEGEFVADELIKVFKSIKIGKK
ncbi:DUF4367 domain-containing protein [Alkaliphilus transvaalensis]|uniref:DUF4367 domain-containing protein n=1 Tax=Alkaliphilus transvaalensis TaxID=114628 RepID=UPI00047986C0|nr:DUF4367 domain-containing protein [Alkaliphilus transvaalensis]